MKVFITGATGYIGFAVARAFRRAGHDVSGLVRSPEKSRQLLQNEIHPVPGNLREPESYLHVARKCSVLVHAAADWQADTAALDINTVDALLEAGRHEARPKILIYTSGVWVHGNTSCETVDETSPLAPAKLVSWRPPVEKSVLESSEVRGLVIRPGCVYGKPGGLTATWFSGAYKEKALQVVGDGNNHWAMVHVDDLAEGYLRAAESGLRGEVFLLADGSRSTVREMAVALARAAGYRGEIQYLPLAEAAKTLGDFAEGLALDQHVDSGKAVRLLGWRPRHAGFIAEVHTFFEAWKAHQELAQAAASAASQ